MARGATVEFGPVGPTLENGYEVGGARIYPWSAGLGIEPPAQFNNYIGDPTGGNIASPVAAMTSPTTGGGTNVSTGALDAVTHPMDISKSPLPWVVLGLFGAVAAMHFMHYK